MHLIGTQRLLFIERPAEWLARNRYRKTDLRIYGFTDLRIYGFTYFCRIWGCCSIFGIRRFTNWRFLKGLYSRNEGIYTIKSVCEVVGTDLQVFLDLMEGIQVLQNHAMTDLRDFQDLGNGSMASKQGVLGFHQWIFKGFITGFWDLRDLHIPLILRRHHLEFHLQWV